MSSFCLISHEPAPAGPCLELARALAARGDRVTILGTGGRDGGPEGDAGFRHLDEVSPAGSRAVFPAVPSHRLALRIRETLTTLRPDAAVFIGNPAHASASVAARACGMDAYGIAIVFDTLGQYRREADQTFPADGREAIATEFLERQALAGADSFSCLDSKVGSHHETGSGRGHRRGIHGHH